jgi:hypothetical protein
MWPALSIHIREQSQVPHNAAPARLHGAPKCSERPISGTREARAGSDRVGLVASTPSRDERTRPRTACPSAIDRGVAKVSPQRVARGARQGESVSSDSGLHFLERIPGARSPGQVRRGRNTSRLTAPSTRLDARERRRSGARRGVRGMDRHLVTLATTSATCQCTATATKNLQ